MAKVDGMDPKLVRQLLGEVRQAAKRMRTVDARVAQLVSSAGLPRQATHRPAQIADSCDDMVRDVTARLALLEKQEKPKHPSAKHPESMGEKQPDTPDKSPAPEAPKDADKSKPEGSDKGDKPEAPRDAGQDGDKGKPEGSDKGDKPEPPKDAGQDGGDDATKPDAGDCADEKKDSGKGGGKDSGSDSTGDSIVDTDGKDHPDDIATGDRKPHVIVVDGVKVVVAPLDPPSAADLGRLNDHMREIKPIDMPAVGGHLDTSGATGPQPDGPADKIPPTQPTHPAAPAAPLPPDTGGEAVDVGDTSSGGNAFASDDLTIVNRDGITVTPQESSGDAVSISVEGPDDAAVRIIVDPTPPPGS